MYYKVEKGCELYDKLMEINKKSKICVKAAHDLLKRLGYQQYISSVEALWGGISAIIILNGQKPPKNWAKRWEGYMPRKDRKDTADLYAEIKALPVITIEEFNAILKYDGWATREKGKTSFHPGISFIKNKKIILISVAEYMKYMPVPGMTEILSSEYQKLKGGIYE